MTAPAATHTSTDPFYVGFHHINNQIQKLREDVILWQTQLSRKPPKTVRSGSDGSQEIIKTLSEVEGLTEDLSKYTMSVHIDQNKRAIGNAEIQRRQMSVEEVRRKLRELRFQIKEIKSQQTIPEKKSGGVFFNTQKQQQEEMMAKQDEQLGELAKSAQRLKSTATTIKKEIDDQKRLLSEIETDVDNERERMNFVMRGLSTLLRTSDKRLIWLIVLLVVVVVVLIILISVI